MDFRILPLFLWICLLFIIVTGQRIPQQQQQPQPPPTMMTPNANSPPSQFPSAAPQPPPQPQPSFTSPGKNQPLPQQPPSQPPLGKGSMMNVQSPPNNQPPTNLHPSLQQGQNSGNSSLHNMQRISKRKNEELANVKDDNVRRVLGELGSTPATSPQNPEVQARVAQLLGPLFYKNFEQRKEHIILQGGKNASLFPQRLLSAFMEIKSNEVKALVLQKRLESLHAADIGLLPMAFLYALQNSALRNITGFNLAGVVKVNRGDTTIAFKAAEALSNRTEEQIEFLQSLGTKILPDAQRMLIQEVLEWWGAPSGWKDRELSLLTAAGDPLLSFIPPSHLESLDEEQADKIVNVLGQSNEMGKVWWMKPMSVKKAWFELAKRARFFGAVQEWSFMRMQKLSFLLEGASPEDLEHIPPLPEIKGLVIGNHYTELQARVVFDAFYKKSPLSQEDLQEFQFHILDLVPSQLQRFDLADSFSTLDDMMVILENQHSPSYPTLLQISYYMWPLVNRTAASSSSTTTSPGLIMAPTKSWQKKELSQIGKLLFLLPKSVFLDLPSEVVSWDSNTLHAIRSKHFSPFQIWFLTSKILSSVEDRFKSDYAHMIPPPFQKGIPTENLTQILLTSPLVRPDTIRVLIEESEGMLTSQKAVIAQRIRSRLQEGTVMRHIISSSKPAELFEMFSPRLIMKIMPNIIKTIMGMPEFGRFGTTAIQAKLFPRSVLSLWMKWVREQAQLTKWTAEDLLGRSAVGSAHAVQLTIMGLTCREVQLIDALDILPVILHYRHEFYALRKFSPRLTFHLSLRSCFLDKVVSYLKIKRGLNGNDKNQTRSSNNNILSELSHGEIIGIGGEVFSLLPPSALEHLPRSLRMQILEEIGRIGMPDLFHFVPLEQLQWYANTLFRDALAAKSAKRGIIRRQVSEENTDKKTKTYELHANSDPAASATDTQMHPAAAVDDSPDPTEDTDPADSVHKDTPINTDHNSQLTARGAESASDESSFIPQQQQITVDTDIVQKLGNFLCYAEDIFLGAWNTQFFKDTLESKSIPGEKSCCLPHAKRSQWFELLKTAYGADPSTWNEFHLAAMGDLLVTVPEEELAKIPRESLANAVHPLLKQSGFDVLIGVPGESKKQRWITICAESLGSEGTEMMHAYKSLMRQVTEGAQFLASTVKTTEELLKDSVGRSGRLPRWAEFTLVRNPRQVPIITGANKQQQQMIIDPQQGKQMDFYGINNRDQLPRMAIVEGPFVKQEQQSFPINQQGQMIPQRKPDPQYAQPQIQQQPGQFAPQIQKSEQGRFEQQPEQEQFGGGFSGQEQLGFERQRGFSGQEQFGAQNQQGFEIGNQNQQQFAGQGRFDIQNQQQPEQDQFGNQFSAQDQFGPQSQGGFEQQPGKGKYYAPPQKELGPQQMQKPGGGQDRFLGPQQQREDFGRFGPQSQQGQQQQGDQFRQFGNQNQGQFTDQQQQGQFNTGGGGQDQFGSRQGQQFGDQQSRFRGQHQQQQGQQQGQFFSPDQRLDLTSRNVHNNNNNQGAMNNSSRRPNNNNAQSSGLETPAELGRSDAHTELRGVSDQVTCNAIKTAGPAAIGLTLDDLQQMSQTDLFNCVEQIGRLEWDEQTKVGILNLLTTKLGFNFHKVKTYELLEIGNLVTALRINTVVEDVSNNGTANSPIDVAQMDLKVPESLDLISILGSKITDSQMLKVLADKFNADNSFFPGNPKKIRPENLRIIVQSLGNIVCGFSDKVVNSIFEADAPLFIDCGQTLGKLEGCSAEVLSTLATHAVRPSNYGPPRHWTQEDLAIIGVVFAGLKPEAISTIAPEAMQGLRTKGMTALPSSSIQGLLPQQIAKMSYDAAKAISPIQKNNLTPQQQEAWNKVVEKKSVDFDAMGNGDDDADSARSEETRDLLDSEDGSSGGSIGGRTKAKNDDHHNTDSEVTSTTPQSPHDNGTTTSTTTQKPESEGETGLNSGSTTNFIVIGPLNLQIIFACVYVWFNNYYF